MTNESSLLDIATAALKRHGTAEKALPGFTDKIWNSAVLLRTVVGAGEIKKSGA